MVGMVQQLVVDAAPAKQELRWAGAGLELCPGPPPPLPSFIATCTACTTHTGGKQAVQHTQSQQPLSQAELFTRLSETARTAHPDRVSLAALHKQLGTAQKATQHRSTTLGLPVLLLELLGTRPDQPSQSSTAADCSSQAQPGTMERVVGLVNRLQQICTQLGDTAGNSILVDKLSSIVVVGGQVRALGASRAVRMVICTQRES